MATTWPHYLQKRCNIPLRCIQINLKHSKTAADNFHLLTKEATIDTAFIQEPHNYNNQVTGIPRNYKVFNSGKERKQAAVVIVNKRIDAILIDQLSDEDTAVIEITHGNIKFIAASIYLDIKNEISEDLRKMENTQRLAKGRGILAAMDNNARSKTWHDVTTKRRGRILEEFLINNRLHIANEDSGYTTFESTRGTSNIDLTVADSTMVKLIHAWQSNERESFSDHRFITFRIKKHAVIMSDYNYNGIKYITSEEGFKQFEDNFIKEIRNNFRIRETLNIDNTLCEIITPESDTEKVVGKYQNSIVVPSTKSFKERQLLQKTIRFKSVPWWTGERTIMRKKRNTIRWRYQRTTQDNNLREARKYHYLQEKRKYEETLRKENIQSWKQYCNITMWGHFRYPAPQMYMTVYLCVG